MEVLKLLLVALVNYCLVLLTIGLPPPSGNELVFAQPLEMFMSSFAMNRGWGTPKSVDCM